MSRRPSKGMPGGLWDVAERSRQLTVHWFMAEVAWLRDHHLPQVADRLEEAAKEILTDGHPSIRDDHDDSFK